MKINLENHLLLLTCTVKPNARTKVKRIDANLRLRDYEKSILRWAKLSNKMHFRIAVLENSNSIELIRNSIPEKYREKIYFLQYPENLEVAVRGISHGEFELLRQFAGENADLFGSEYLWKITGRLFVPNFANLIPRGRFNLTVNRFYSPRHLIDTRIIGFSAATFRKFMHSNPDFYENTPDSESILFETHSKFASIEDLVTNYAHRCEMSGIKVDSMRKVPIFEGSSASIDKRIDSFTIRLGTRAGNLVRPVAIKMLRGSAP